ncbi:MAG TPA: hypothetical protein VH540_01690 [Ktedonobacterales bacterium]
MRQRHHKGLFFLLPLFILLAFLLESCTLSGPDGPSTKVAVDLTAPIGTSQFSPGFSYVDTSLEYPAGNNDQNAVNQARSLLKGVARYVDTSIMGWGVDDPWPDPNQSEPSNWSSLDAHMRLILATGGIPVLTLAEAPWWMKGQLQPNGTTRLLTQADEWADIAYGSRVLDNKLDAWLLLVQRVAERYMVPPYNVRYFQVWNELKGYYNPQTNAYDYTTSQGKPGAPVAQHGYTYMYNLVYERLMQTATSLNIAPTSIQVGGPYVVMDTWSTPAQSNSSSLSSAYGTYDQRSLDVVQYWLQNKAGAGFITIDSGNRNKDNIDVTDPFNAAEKFADITRWIRTLDPQAYPGARTLPIWWAEWYASPYPTPFTTSYDNAVKTYALIKLLEAGGAVALSWGSPGNDPSSAGLWTPTTAGGGQPYPWYSSLKALNDDFPPGTLLYHTAVSFPDTVEALASAKKIMLVNKLNRPLSVSVASQTIQLAPYQVSVLNL